MVRYLASFFAVFLTLIGSAWLWVANRPMSFMQREYGMWGAKIEMCRELPAQSVIILGDSRAVTDMIPKSIGPDVANLAFGMGTPIDALAVVRVLLASARPPRAAVLSFSPVRVMENSFWERGVMFGLFDSTMIEEVRDRSRVLQDPLFGPKSIGEVDARLKSALCLHHFPSFYSPSLINGRVFQREAENWRIHREVRESLGYHAFGTLEGCRELSPECLITSFKPSPLLDDYFAKLVALLQSRNIPVVFIGCPVNELTAAALHPGFAAAYVTYIKDFETRYPGFHVLGDSFPTFSWTSFGDADHLNPQGAALFSDRVAVLLRNAGIEK